MTDIIDKTIDRYILENDLLGKVPTTRQLQEQRSQHLHDWVNGKKEIVNGKEITRCGRNGCQAYMMAGHRIIDPNKPRPKIINMKNGRNN